MQAKRKHHYVQARYLDGFLAEAETQLWCYGRHRPESFRAISDELANQRDFYAIPDAPVGSNIEDYLEKSVESPGLNALRELVGRLQPPTLEARIALGRYIAFQEMRVPHTRELIRKQHLHTLTHIEKQLRAQGGRDATIYPYATAEGEIAKRGEAFTITMKEAQAHLAELERNLDTFDLPMMVELANEFFIFFVQMRWTILIAPDSSDFITSDNPVFRCFTDQNLHDSALLRPDCMVFCPLTKKAVLLMEHDFEFLEVLRRETEDGNGHTLPPTRFREISAEEVVTMNVEIAEQCTSWCFSGKPLEWLPEVLANESKRSEVRFYSDHSGYGARWTHKPGPS